MYQERTNSTLISLITKKDSQGRYLQCNKNVLLYSNLNNQKAIFGKTNFHLPWHKYANIYQEHDHYALQHHNHTAIVPFIDHAGVDKLLLEIRYKIQLSNQQSGIACYSIVIEDEIQSHDTEDDKVLSKLTDREIACFYYLIKGQCAKSISKKLSISPRTVEKHIHSIRRKIGCKKKKEIVNYALKHQCIHIVNQLSVGHAQQALSKVI